MSNRFSMLGRQLRLAVVNNVFMQSLVTKEEALELLRGPLAPEDETTIVDDSGLFGDPDALSKIEAEASEMACRFEMRVRKSALKNVFHCAARDGWRGFAYLWSHKPEWRDPCRGCGYFVAGEPIEVERELNYDEFCKKAGELIRSEDWAYFKTKGIKP